MLIVLKQMSTIFSMMNQLLIMLRNALLLKRICVKYELKSLKLTAGKDQRLISILVELKDSWTLTYWDSIDRSLKVSRPRGSNSQVLSNQATTSTPERSFNISGNILNVRRCSLYPTRAEKLIVSAFCHRCKLRSDKKPPRVPSFRVLEDEDVEVEEEDDEDDVRERQEIETVAWEAFFDDE